MSPGPDGQFMFKDPCLPWIGAFPYERLDELLKSVGHTGVSPSASAAEINDCLYDLMQTGRPLANDDRRVWDELHRLDRRLFIDFLLYQFAANDNDSVNAAVFDFPLPVALPDFAPLADFDPDLTRAVPIPDSVDPGEAPAPLPVDWDALELSPLDIGVTLPDGRKFLEAI